MYSLAVAKPGRARNIVLVLAALLLAFSFLGTRGLFDPDEGRYTNVALTMLDTGDWLNPQRNDDTGHWTKPPLTYWAIATSVAAFGSNAWAARLPMALAYLACVWLCWRSARRLAPGRESLAALAYMTMLMPFMAAQLVTTDFLLSAFQALGMWAYLEGRFREDGLGHWPLMMWAAFALAFMTKGPPALLPLLVIAVFAWLSPSQRPPRKMLQLGGFVLFLAIALPWFAIVTYEHKGLLAYFLGSEVVARVASNQFARHGEWYGWAEVYVPTLLLGTLPWTLRIIAWARGLPTAIRGWRLPNARVAEAPALLLALWVLLPLLVFCIARSRLPLYLLPIFVPLALVVAQQAPADALAWPRWRWLAAWGVALLAMRIGAALYPSDQDASRWADAIQSRISSPVLEVTFIEDMPRYGLHLYLHTEVETLSFDDLDEPAYNPEYDESLATELAEAATETGVVYVTKQKLWPAVNRRVQAHGFRAQPLGTPFHGRVIFVVSKLPDLDHLYCDNCDEWNQPQAPFNIYGNTWYVGTAGLSAILVTSPEGHVLMDGALPQSAAQIQANIEALGFKIRDVKLIVNSHEHYDHAGGIAALQRASGATVAASAAGARALRQGTVGRDDPLFDARSPVHFPKVDEVSEVVDGQTLRVGTVVVTAHATPGHTPGATTWSWTSCQADQCRAVVYADSLNPVSSDGFRFSGGNGQADISKSFAASIAKLAGLKCDIVLSTHPGASGTLEKQASRTASNNPFVNPASCRDYAAVAAEKLRVRLGKEGESAPAD